MKTLNDIYSAFFAKENPEPLGLFRILAGALIVVTFLNDAPFIADYYSNEGFVSNEAIPDVLRDYRFSLLDYVGSPVGVYALYLLLLLSAFFLTIGFKTRIAAVITFILVLSFQERNPMLLDSADSILRIMAFYLAVADSGAAYSVDAMLSKLKGEKQRLVPKWQPLLIKFQTSIIYFFSGFAKAQGPLWVNGTAAYYAVNNSIFNRFSMEWLNDAPWLANLMTWGTVLVELSAPFLLWFRATRLWAIGMVAALQLGISATMNIGTFQLIGIAITLIFLEKTDIDAFWRWLGKGKSSYLVIYDGSCEFCKKCVAALRSMDLLQRLIYADFRQPEFAKKNKDKLKELESELWLVSKDQRVYKGFYAFRKMAALLPALWITVPFLHLPSASFFGKKAYGWVSRNRFHLGCKSCTIK